MSIYKSYYVYIYLRESDNTPYYVGKGRGNRYKKKHRVNIPSNEENIIFVKENLTNEEACSLEKELISLYGRKDLGNGILQNQTDGGDGGDTSKSENYQKWLINEARNKESEYNKRQSQRMKEKNPLHNPKVVNKCHSPEIHKKISETNKGKKKSKEHKEKIRKTILKQSDEISKRQKNLWKDKKHREKQKDKMKLQVLSLKNMSEEEFYVWISDKKLFTYDPTRKILRPNGRVKCIIDHFNKTEEFYGEYYNERKNYQKNLPPEDKPSSL